MLTQIKFHAKFSTSWILQLSCTGCDKKFEGSGIFNKNGQVNKSNLTFLTFFGMLTKKNQNQPYCSECIKTPSAPKQVTHVSSNKFCSQCGAKITSGKFCDQVCPRVFFFVIVVDQFFEWVFFYLLLLVWCSSWLTLLAFHSEFSYFRQFLIQTKIHKDWRNLLWSLFCTISSLAISLKDAMKFAQRVSVIVVLLLFQSISG